MMQKLFLLAVAGALGTLARYGLGGWVQRWGGASFPWGTLIVNMTGCFLFGIVWAIALNRVEISGTTRAIFLTGFMGAFTTFSTYMFETVQMTRDAEWLLAAANVAGQTVVGFLLMFLGMTIGRLV
ncbi:MAG TPA: chromosome condensation protein CrcB [Verrucomicrobia bacterium]|nr:MAG: chromosome condensation protein CrcB [Lentisphaerae bacterium GWF2_57_35]HBA86127.1 chromosome condensation protein CrcB [Verrucomicrobiota bacterium]